MTSCEHKPASVARGHIGPAGIVARLKVGARGKDPRAFGADSEALSVLMMANRRLLGWKWPLAKRMIEDRCSETSKLYPAFPALCFRWKI